MAWRKTLLNWKIYGALALVLPGCGVRTASSSDSSSTTSSSPVLNSSTNTSLSNSPNTVTNTVTNTSTGTSASATNTASSYTSTSTSTSVSSTNTSVGSGTSTSTTTVVTRGSRELGVDILDTTPTSSFDDNISMAKAAGASYMILSLGWDQIEASTPSDCTTPGNYVDPYGGVLGTFNSTLPSSGLKLSLSILPISTNVNLMPSNLSGMAFDNALVVCRFQKMLEFVFSKIPNVQLVSVQFGNEIDAYPAANQVSFWSQYWNFFTQVSATVKTLRSGVKVSVVSTLYGATGQSTNTLAQGGLQQIYKAADIVAVTYYPLNSNFTVKNPSVVEGDIGSLVKLYPSQTIYFNEIGYPSGSSYDGSSQALQQQFVSQVFATWDKYPEQIGKMSFLRLNDLSLSDAQSRAAGYSLGSNNAFVEYLETLGLVTYSGSNKAGYQQLVSEITSRSW